MNPEAAARFARHDASSIRGLPGGTGARGDQVYPDREEISAKYLDEVVHYTVADLSNVSKPDVIISGRLDVRNI